MQHFFVRLLGTREGWPEGMTPAEQETMGLHFVYLQGLAQEGRVLLAGPVLEPTFGLIVLEVEDETAARRIMDAEPSVLAGLHTYELQSMRVAIRAGAREGRS